LLSPEGKSLLVFTREANKKTRVPRASQAGAVARVWLCSSRGKGRVQGSQKAPRTAWHSENQAV